MARKIVPIATRRLTKAEAAKLGVSYSAKRQVPVTLKRITIKTKTYSLREVREAKYGTTVEKHTLINKIEKRDFTVIPSPNWFGNLPRQSLKVLRQMVDATGVEEWQDALQGWLEEHEEEPERNPFFYH